MNDRKKDPPKQLLSLDALRGFGMFFIIGGGVLIHKIILRLNLTWLQWLIPQLHHPKFGGTVTAYDFIFPIVDKITQSKERRGHA